MAFGFPPPCRCVLPLVQRGGRLCRRGGTDGPQCRYALSPGELQPTLLQWCCLSGAGAHRQEVSGETRVVAASTRGGGFKSRSAAAGVHVTVRASVKSGREPSTLGYHHVHYTALFNFKFGLKW